MQSSPIRKLAPFAEEAKRNGVKVYHLNIGQPDIPTPQVGLDALKTIGRKTLEYSPSQGFSSLRAGLSRYYGKFGISVSPEEIMVTTGGSEAILMSFLALFDPGDELIVTEPSYANYISFAAVCGIRVIGVRTSIEEGFRLPSVEAIEERITSRTRAILLCNPNNPTGYLYTRDELLRLRDIVLKHGLYLISDEVYREFVYSDEPFLSALALEGVEDNVVLVDSVSKRYSECGIRIGALVTRNRKVLEAVMKIAQARLSPPLLGQIVAECSLDAPKEYLEGVFEEYRDRRDFLIEALNRIPGVYTPMPEGAFYTMVRLPVDDAEKFCKWCLTDFKLVSEKYPKGETVMMAPGAGFYADPEPGRQQVRMAYVLCEEDLERAVYVLSKALAAYNGL